MGKMQANECGIGSEYISGSAIVTLPEYLETYCQMILSFKQPSFDRTHHNAFHLTDIPNKPECQGHMHRVDRYLWSAQRSWLNCDSKPTASGARNEPLHSADTVVEG